MVVGRRLAVDRCDLSTECRGPLSPLGVGVGNLSHLFHPPLTPHQKSAKPEICEAEDRIQPLETGPMNFDSVIDVCLTLLTRYDDDRKQRGPIWAVLPSHLVWRRRRPVSNSVHSVQAPALSGSNDVIA